MNAVSGMVDTIALGDHETVLCQNTKSRGTVQSLDHQGTKILTVTQKISNGKIVNICLIYHIPRVDSPKVDISTKHAC